MYTVDGLKVKYPGADASMCYQIDFNTTGTFL